MDKNAKILIVGHRDIYEYSLQAYLKAEQFSNVLTSSQARVDIFDKMAVTDFIGSERFDYVFLCSSRSGGIEANRTRPAEFIHANLSSQVNVIEAACRHHVKKLLFFSSSCVYPKASPQPIKEEYLMTGPLEPTSEAYATAKLAGIRMCQAYRRQYNFNAAVMIPATVYGPGEETDLASAHVLGALMAKFHHAAATKSGKIAVWGSGRPRREFIFGEDFARAAVHVMDHYEEEQIINAGPGEDIAISDLARMMAEITGFKGEIIFDASKPDGALQKLLDSQRIVQSGWKPAVSLKDGLARMYDWYRTIVNNGVKT